MKKIAIATILAAAAMSASALEVGVTGTRDYAGDNRNGGGVTLGTKVGSYGATAGIERTTQGTDAQTRISLVGDREVVKMGKISVAARVGVAHLDNTTAVDGYALTVGVGATVPVTKQVSVGLAVDRQYGQDRVQAFDGNRVTAAVKYSF